MATTSLRIYLHDIEGMVGAGQMDEAIAHCRYILQTFPKSIAVYRLLGKAFLESQRYSDAADVLQRVLSAVPDDFISHVGMSIIREDEGNLDASIWHMERAFEVQPYNTAIQDELRRLYGRRDGMEPPKMRLTRGALARMYMKGNLYQQAIGELRAALAEDPQRIDLQALLARVYYMTGQRVEAVETCSTLLKKLPFCLDANILLGAILPETERAQDAQNYRQRAISLDPYFAQAPSNAQTADNVPASAINVEKLIYSPGKVGAGEEGQPAWATSLGVAFKEQKEGEALPDWLASSSEGFPKQAEESTGESIAPFSQAELPDTFPWEPPSDETTPSAAEPTSQEAIPDWMKEAGWEPSTGAVQESPVSFNLQEEAAAPEEGALAPADIPDWLREAAPPGVLDQPPAPAEEKSIVEELPWLQETPPGSSDTIVTWLNETKPEVIHPAEEAPSSLPADLFEQLETEGTGLEGPGGQAEASQAEIPDWLKESAPPTQAEAAAEPSESVEIPDWLQPSGPVAQEMPKEEAQKTPEEELPDWLKGSEAETPAISTELPDWLEAGAPPEEAPAAQAEQFAPGVEEIPDWMKTEATTPEGPTPLQEAVETVPPEQSLETEAPVTAEPTQAGPVEPSAPAEEFPAWLKEVEAEIPEEAVETPQLKGVTDWLETVNTGDLTTGPIGITDWLSKVEPGQEPPTPEPEAAPADDIPEWLRGIMAAKQAETAAGEEPQPGVPAEEIPERLTAAEPEAPAGITPPAETAPATPAEELPDRMKEIETGTSGIPTGISEAGASEISEESALTREAIPGEVTTAFESGLPAGLDLSDQDAALAWLESLAAKQGVPEEELITKPEAREEVQPIGEQQIPEQTPAAPAEEVPDWLKEVEAEIPEAAAPAAEAAPAEVAPLPEGKLPEGLDLSDQDAALAWLEGLAAKQGAPEEELITKPEARTETLPTLEEEPPEQAPAAPVEEVPEWLKEVEAEIPEETVPAAEVIPPAPAEEVPDWLKEVEAEIPEAAAPAAVAAPAEVAPLPEGKLPEGLDLSDQDAALAWLEGLAAKQGAPEEELITKPEARTEILPTLEEEPPEQAPAAAAEELPGWLKTAAEEVDQEAAEEEQIIIEKGIQFEAITPTTTEAAPEGIPLPTSEWIKETELPEWQEKAQVTQPEEKIAPEAELPGWIADAAAQDTALAWVPPQIPETEEKIPARKLTELNTASIGELERLPGIGFVLAQSIINHRDARGPFTQIDELLNVPGIGQGILDVLKDWITIQPLTAEVALEKGAESLDPDHLILRRAQKALQEGEIPTAIKQYEQLLNKLVLLNEIILDLQDALYRYPVDISIWQALGDAYMRNNQLQDALDAYTKAEELLR